MYAYVNRSNTNTIMLTRTLTHNVAIKLDTTLKHTISITHTLIMCTTLKMSMARAITSITTHTLSLTLIILSIQLTTPLNSDTTIIPTTKIVIRAIRNTHHSIVPTRNITIRDTMSICCIRNVNITIIVFIILILPIISTRFLNR